MALSDPAARTPRRADWARADRRHDAHVRGRCARIRLRRITVATRESPAPLLSLGFRGPVEDQELVWWARDDRGNDYLSARRSDELRFTTPLDPLATTLELMPTAVDCRAVITFSLRWVDSGV